MLMDNMNTESQTKTEESKEKIVEQATKIIDEKPKEETGQQIPPSFLKSKRTMKTPLIGTKTGNTIQDIAKSLQSGTYYLGR